MAVSLSCTRLKSCHTTTGGNHPAFIGRPHRTSRQHAWTCAAVCACMCLCFYSQVSSRGADTVFFFSFTQRYCQLIFKDRTGGGQRVVVDVLEERVKKNTKKMLQMYTFILFKSSRRIVKLNCIHISGGETAGENVFGGGQMSSYTPEGLDQRSITNRR